MATLHPMGNHSGALVVWPLLEELWTPSYGVIHVILINSAAGKENYIMHG